MMGQGPGRRGSASPDRYHRGMMTSPVRATMAAFALVVVGACSDPRAALDAGAPDGGFEADADLAADAAALDALAQDAASADAFAADAAPAFSLRVLELGVAQPGIQVVLGHADGTLVGTFVTDAEGRVTPSVSQGDMITALWSRAGEPYAQSFVGLLPAEKLEVDVGTFVPPGPGAPLGEVSVGVGAFPAGTAAVVVDGGCGEVVSAAPPFVAPIVLAPHATCHPQAGPFALLASARAVGGAVLGYQVLTLQPGGSATLADAWLDPEERSISLAASLAQQRQDARFAAVTALAFGAQTFAAPMGAVQVGALDSHQAFTYFPALSGTTRSFYAAVETSAGQGSGRQSQLKIAHDAPWNAFFDGDTVDVVADGQLSPGAPGRPILTWTTESGLPAGAISPAAFLFRVRGSTLHWTIIASYDTTSVTFPELPDTLAAWRPSDAAVQASSVDWTTVVVSGIQWTHSPLEIFDQFVAPDLTGQPSLLDARWLARIRTDGLEGWLSFATSSF
jgi:hypothetical protein